MAGMLQMRRSRGAFSGFLLILLGLWGALIPFIGPYFDFAYTPDKAWTYNTGRLWLELLPGAAVFLGGFFLMAARGRHTALFGALLAVAAGGWFVLGQSLSPLWNHHVAMGGTPASSTQYMRIMEQLGFFTALGVVIVFVAATALGRIASVASGIRPVDDADEVDEAPESTVPAERVPAARTAPADTVPVERVPAGSAPLPPRTRMEPVATRTEAEPAKRSRLDRRSRTEETRPAQDTTGTVGSGTVQ
jgi:hypothetical protein